MARYSVYNFGTKRFDVYDDGKPTPTHANAPTVISLSGVGATPEGAAVRVPVGARKVGESELAQGRIASMGDPGSDLPTLGIYAAIAYVAYKIIKR